VQRIIVGDPLAKQQSSNAVRVLNALPQQRRALARDPTAVLFARAWRHCHGTDPRLAALPGHQRAQQRLAVDRIRLGAPVASRHGNRRRIDDVALDAVGLEQAMNPETIEPDFVDRHNLDRRCNALLGSGLQPRKKVEQFAPVIADERVLDIFLLPGASDVATMSNDSALTRRTKWHSLPGCRSAREQEDWYRHALVAPSTQWWATST